MKRVIILMCILFLLQTSCANEIEFMRESYSPSETIIGKMNNVLNELKQSDIKIYEDRRELSFEKGLIKQNDTYYFYLIPVSGGVFNIKIDNVLFNDSGKISVKTLTREVNISENASSLNYGIRPGVYEGISPEIVLYNLNEETKNISSENGVIELKARESMKIKLEVPQGFSFYQIGEYSVPVISFNQLEETESLNLTEENQDCFSIIFSELILVEANITKNYSLELINNCPTNFSSLMIKSNREEINFTQDKLNFLGYETINLWFSVLVQETGEFLSEITISNQNKILYSNYTKIYSFENTTSIENFANSPLEKKGSCVENGGQICTELEVCQNTDSYWDYTENRPCCLSGCINPNKTETNWFNILIALFGFGIISLILYYLYKRSKSFNAPRAEDKFKETDKKMKNVILNKK